MTISEAKKALKEFGVTLKKNSHGEFEVRLNGAPKSSIYHTDDIEDAVSTGYAIAAEPNKREFRRLLAESETHFHEVDDNDPWLVLAGAGDNASDTAREHGWKGEVEDYPRYWDVALDSIQCSIEANCLEAKLFPWFKQHGHKI